jgi:hypothetical protein
VLNADFEDTVASMQQVALALSDSTRRLAVARYYTVAMDLQYNSYSPVFMGEAIRIQVLHISCIFD